MINTIRMLERYTKSMRYQMILDGFRMWDALQGEQAILSVENHIDCLMENDLDPDEVCPLYSNLIDGLERREGEVGSCPKND